MKSRLGDKVRIQHIDDSIREIDKYSSGVNFQTFQENTMMQYAVIKQLEIIGEAVAHLSDKLKSSYKDVKWKEIIGLRNILIHEYFGIDIKLIWDIMKDDIPILKTKVEDILKDL